MMGLCLLFDLCRPLVRRLIRRDDLTADEVEDVFNCIFNAPALNEDDTVLLSAFLTALAAKGETVQEVLGAARSMRFHAKKISAGTQANSLTDIVGTGGDSLHTFNVSTTSSFVVAGAGVTIAKHGNRAVSGKSGSADVLEACGVNLMLQPERVEEIIASIGIGFLFAPQFHPAMKRVVPLRKALGIRTLFNLLGPLTNPAGANYVLLGVYEPKLTEMFAAVAKELGVRRTMVVHGSDGMDEITVTGTSRITECFGGSIRTYDFMPELYFDEPAAAAELEGGDAQVNAGILQGILDGSIQGAKRNIVLLNSAAALVTAEKVRNIAEGLNAAAESIDSGAAAEKLRLLIVESRN